MTGSPIPRVFQVVVQNNVMVLATSECSVIRWSLEGASDPERKPVPHMLGLDKD